MANQEGWIKLHRKFQESPLWKFAINARLHYLISLWTYCLLSANWVEIKWYDGKEEIILPEGSFITSIKHLSESLSISPQQARTGLHHIERMQMITRRITNRWTLIQIVNWRKYQMGEVVDNTPDNKTITRRQQTDNKRITTDKEYKNIRNKEYIYINIGAASPENKKRGNGFVSVGSLLGNNPLRTRFQSEAIRFAKNLNINLEDADKKLPSIRARFFKLFKDAEINRREGLLSTAYSYCYDNPTFRMLSPDKKILFFMWKFNNPNKEVNL